MLEPRSHGASFTSEPSLLVAIALREEGTTLCTGPDERMEERKAEELTDPQRGRALS